MKKLFPIIMFCMSMMLPLVSCTNLDETNQRLDDLEYQVTDLQSTLKVLSDAFNEGKQIKNITTIDDGFGGWKVTFSDNSYIEMPNTKKIEEARITPILKVDQDGYFTISYDNGTTFSRLKDNEGKDISANTISITVTTNEQNNYVFKEYLTNNPANIINEIITPLSADDANAIKAITENEKTHVITLTMANGQTFTFNKEHNSPTSIAILSTQTITMSQGATTTIEFRVNPQNALFCYDTNSENCQIEIDRVAVSRTANSYVNTPVGYKLLKVEQCFNEQGVLKQGQYKATLEDEGKGTIYDDQVVFVINTVDENGNAIQISSSAFRVKYASCAITSFSFKKALNLHVLKDVEGIIDGNDITICSPYITNAEDLIANFKSNGKVYIDNIEQKSGASVNDFTNNCVYKVVADNGDINYYNVHVMYSGLPVMEINTPDAAEITSKEEWINNVSFDIINSDGSIDCSGTMQMKGRGNSTWAYPKKPYAIKLDSKAKVLGMAKEKRFDLLANWMDRTLMRNDVTFHLANMTSSMGWNPHGKFVEVILNGKHIGNYYLCEHIKVSENRVNIKELDTNATEGNAITGGYIMELDVNYDEVNKFKSSYYNLPYMFKDPDEVNDSQIAYMQQYVSDMEAALYDDTKFANREYLSYMDIDSYIDWWFIHELSGNGEPIWPKSTYMHKDMNGKMIAGPVWDFDWGTYTNDIGWYDMNAVYYSRLFQDPIFVETVKNRWNSQKDKFAEAVSYIQETADYLKHSDEINNALWPISQRVNGDEDLTYINATSRMKEIFQKRIEWMDKAINDM